MKIDIRPHCDRCERPSIPGGRYCLNHYLQCGDNIKCLVQDCAEKLCRGSSRRTFQLCESHDDNFTIACRYGGGSEIKGFAHLFICEQRESHEDTLRAWIRLGAPDQTKLRKMVQEEEERLTRKQKRDSAIQAEVDRQTKLFQKRLRKRLERKFPK